MWNTKLKFATLTLGTVLTLVGPAVASARDRDDFNQRTIATSQPLSATAKSNGKEKSNEFAWNANASNKDGIAIAFGIIIPNDHRTYSNGYYDNAGRWCPYR